MLYVNNYTRRRTLFHILSDHTVLDGIHGLGMCFEQNTLHEQSLIGKELTKIYRRLANCLICYLKYMPDLQKQNKILFRYILLQFFSLC